MFGCDKAVVGDLIYTAVDGSGVTVEDEEIITDENDVEPVAESVDPDADGTGKLDAPPWSP